MAETAERFWSKVDRRGLDECWEWLGAKLVKGYGHFFLGGTRQEGNRRWVLAHRFAYEELVGPIPDGLDLDHLCRNVGCCNPAHLEPVSRSVNLLRGVGVGGDRRSASFRER